MEDQQPSESYSEDSEQNLASPTRKKFDVDMKAESEEEEKEESEEDYSEDYKSIEYEEIEEE